MKHLLISLACAMAFVLIVGFFSSQTAVAMPPNYSDVKTCCHIDGRCVVVQRWKLCPRGFY